MKVIVTALKAPWPEGVRNGAIVELPGDKIPDWAVGKCTKAPDDAEAAFTWAPPAAADTTSAVKPAEAAELQHLLDAERQAHTEVGELLKAEQAKVATLTAERDAALAEVEKLKAEHAGGKSAKPKA